MSTKTILRWTPCLMQLCLMTIINALSLHDPDIWLILAIFMNEVIERNKQTNTVYFHKLENH